MSTVLLLQPPLCLMQYNIVSPSQFIFQLEILSLLGSLSLFSAVSYLLTLLLQDELRDTMEEKKSPAASLSAQRSRKQNESVNTAPDSPSKQLPDQISFFSGNPSVEIVHGIMHLYKTK